MNQIFNSFQQKVIPPVLASSCAAIQIISAFMDFPTIRFLLFMICFLGGVALLVSTALTLKSHKTSFKHLEKPTKLLTDGIFSYSRNPIYIGMLLALIGFAIEFYSFLGGLIVIGFYYVFDKYYIPMEEKECKSIFKEEYENYCAKVPRWI